MIPVAGAGPGRRLALPVMDDRIRRLEELLRSERELRQRAEERNAGLIERAALWRRRAEERSKRIDRLLDESRPARLLRAFRARRASAPPGVALGGGDSPQTLPTPSRPLLGYHLASVPVASAVTDPGLAATLDVMQRNDLASKPAAPASSDLVVVEPAAYLALDDDSRSGLRAWLQLEARQPLVVWARTGDDLARVEELTAAAAVVAVAAPTGHPPGTVLLPPTFAVTGPPVAGGDTGSGTVTVTEEDLAAPSDHLLAAAASGTPVMLGGSDTDHERAAVAARRWAYRDHAPWVRARRLLDLAGVDAPAVLPRAAGILLTRRPDDAVAQLAALARQTYPVFEAVVGLHGVVAPQELTATVARSPFPVTVVEMPASITLGEALNRAIDRTGATVIAKTDDDDHYGPGHIEDAVHALAYSGADIVGKGAMFTYVEAEDRTVIRRPGQEERFTGGLLTGGTLVFRRSIWERVPFPHRTVGEDNAFLNGARALGAGVYVNSRYEFCYMRRAGGHTWVAGDEVFLAGSEPAWQGRHSERVEVPDLDVR